MAWERGGHLNIQKQVLTLQTRFEILLKEIDSLKDEISKLKKRK